MLVKCNLIGEYTIVTLIIIILDKHLNRRQLLKYSNLNVLNHLISYHK